MSDQKEYRKNLLEEARDLGLDFPANIKTTLLQEKVDIAQGQSIGVSAPVEKPEPVVTAAKETPAVSAHIKKRQEINARRQAAMKTKVVTITNKDTRDAEFTTTAPLSFENSHFGVAKNVPLDVPVELEVSLIKIAEQALMTIHRDEIVGGKRTGNKVAMSVKKYAISYGDNA